MKDHGHLSDAFTLCSRYDMLPDGATVLCAVSGGADSVCLLHWLYAQRESRKLRLVAAHYNHQLRGAQSDRDERFVRDLVATLPGVELVVGRGDVDMYAAQNKLGIEEAARDLRYAFLEQTAQATRADVIATAHNANDNAESFFLNLLRGCGLNGLCAIPPRRGHIVRPLLTTPRREIEAYLTAHGLPHVEDGSNADQRYTRNRLRARLMPLLEQLFPAFLDHMTQTVTRLREDEAYLAQQTLEQFPSSRSADGGLWVDAAAVAALPAPLAIRGIRSLWEQLSGDRRCTAAHLQAVLDLCRSREPSARCHLPGGVTARRVYGQLVLMPQGEPAPYRLSVSSITYQGQPQAPFAFYLASPSRPVPRSRRTGDRLTRPGRPGKTVKKLMIDEKIPRHLRDALPVLECDGRIAAVVGLGPDGSFVPTPGQPCWYVEYTDQNGKE